MTRALQVTALLAMGLLVASSTAAAQDAPAATSGGQVTISTLSVPTVASSKFTEYREVPKGVSMPYVNLFATNDKIDFNLTGLNVRQGDQQYTGWLKTSAFGLSFDYNQIPHNMGNGGRTFMSELAPGVWGMSATLRQALGTGVDTMLPTSLRTVTFYDALLAQTFAATNSVDISGTRNRGTYALTLGGNLPIDVTLSYMHELKSGYRGAGGGGLYSAISSVIEVPEPLNELTQDFGIRAEYRFKAGNVHAAFMRNLYNNRAETLTVDNPFQPFDAPYTAASGSIPALGGAGRGRWINAPDNEASTGTAGFLLKFARQTRVGADVALATWTQNAPFYPFTINSALLTPAGARADSLSALPQASLNGKINTATLNFTFSSRPLPGLGLRAQYRSYELENRTTRFVVAGDVGGTPDRSWSTNTPTADAPYGHATANPYDSKTERFTASAGYDLGLLTLEGQVRTAKLTRTNREATSGKDNGYALSALFHAADWLGFRGTFDQAKRTAEGHTIYGFQADEAERKTKRTGVDVELTPMDGLDVTFAYFRRDVDYPNRPDRIALSGGVPAAGASPIPGTPSGLLSAKYDSYTAEIGYLPNARVELGAYYTYEKDASTVRWHTTTGVVINNSLTYAGRDETDTFGARAQIQLVPEKWTFSLNAMRQKVDGLMDVTANAAGAFFTARATVGGPVDITDYDDTKLTTVTAQLDHTITKAWQLSFGYMFEKYDFADAYTSGDLLMPQAVLIFMKPNSGAYDVNVLFAKLNYRF